MNWLLLRGLSRESRHWNGFEHELEERVPGARAVCLDLPGTGVRRHLRSPASMAGIVLDLRSRWIDLREQFPGPWGVLGVSLGGMAALEWCAREPCDFERLVLVNSSARSWDDPWRRLRPRAQTHLLAVLLLGWSPRVYERIVMSMVSNARRDDGELLDRFTRWRAEGGASLASTLAQFWAAARFRCPPRPSAASLVLCSARDGMVHPLCSHRLAETLGAALREHPTAGHELTLDDPEWAAQSVAEWCASGEEPPS